MEYSDLLILGQLVATSIGMVLYSMWPAKRGRRDHVLRRMAGKRSEQELNILKATKSSNAAQRMLERVAPIAMRPVMPKNEEGMSTLREKLRQRGLPPGIRDQILPCEQDDHRLACGGRRRRLCLGQGLRHPAHDGNHR